MTIACYRVTGTLIPVASDHDDAGAQRLVAAAPIPVDIILVSTDPAFPKHTAGWQTTLGYVAWRWERPPTITQLEDQ